MQRAKGPRDGGLLQVRLRVCGSRLRELPDHLSVWDSTADRCGHYRKLMRTPVAADRDTEKRKLREERPISSRSRRDCGRWHSPMATSCRDRRPECSAASISKVE